MLANTTTLRTAQQSGSSGKYAPVDDSSGGPPGLCLEILRAVERADPSLRFSGLALHAPLRRIEHMLAQQEIDAFFCLLKTPERERQWRYLPVPLFRVRHILIQRVDDPAEIKTYAELAAAGRRKPVLVMQGTVLQTLLESKQVPTTAPPSEREALRMLLAGRTDAVYGQDLNLLRNMRDAELAGQLRVAATVFAEEPQYAVVARHVPVETERRLVKALEALERDGTLKALAAKYR